MSQIMPIFWNHLHGCAMYTQKQRILGATVRVDSPQHATLDSADDWGLCDDIHFACFIVTNVQVLCHDAWNKVFLKQKQRST